MNKVDFPSLTGIRAIAAYMVYIYHFFPFNSTFFSQDICNFFNEFHVGVTIFFVLSGFLISHRYFDDDNFNFKVYMTRRMARIYPMYFFLTTLTFVYFAIFESQTRILDLKSYLLNITFMRGFFEDYKFSGIAQGWSLTVEEIFYFSLPLFFILIRRSKVFLFILPLMFILLGFFMVSIFSGFNFYGFMKSNTFMMNFTFFGRISEFMIGIALALFLKKNQNISTQYFTFGGILVIILSIYLLSTLKIGNGTGKDCIQGQIINNILLPLFGIAPLFWGLIKEKTIFARIFASDLFVLLGKSSYVFYLIHMGVFEILLNKISDNCLYLFVVLNLISVLLYLLLEAPLNKYFRSRIYQPAKCLKKYYI